MQLKERIVWKNIKVWKTESSLVHLKFWFNHWSNGVYTHVNRFDVWPMLVSSLLTPLWPLESMARVSGNRGSHGNLNVDLVDPVNFDFVAVAQMASLNAMFFRGKKSVPKSNFAKISQTSCLLCKSRTRCGRITNTRMCCYRKPLLSILTVFPQVSTLFGKQFRFPQDQSAPRAPERGHFPFFCVHASKNNFWRCACNSLIGKTRNGFNRMIPTSWLSIPDRYS